MGATILILAMLAGDPGRMVAGYWRAPAPAQPQTAEQFPPPDVLLALPLPASRTQEGQYPLLLDVQELEALYQHTRRPALLYELARKHQAAGNDAEAEAYFRAYLGRAPALDPYHDEAWYAVVEYRNRRDAETVAAAAARARAAVPEALAVMLAAMGVWR